jgi:hypothetical protein
MYRRGYERVPPLRLAAKRGSMECGGEEGRGGEEGGEAAVGGLVCLVVPGGEEAIALMLAFIMS